MAAVAVDNNNNDEQEEGLSAFLDRIASGSMCLCDPALNQGERERERELRLIVVVDRLSIYILIN